MTGLDEVRCPRGHLTSAKFPFCTECGAELNAEGEDDNVVRCPNGHVVTGGHKFCIECGAPVEAPATSEPEPATLAGPADDIAEVDEVRCPKGHLTPAEYPYCIICGAELEKKDEAIAAPPARTPAKRSVRRRPRAIPAVTPEEAAASPDEPPALEPPGTEEITPPPSPSARRAPRPRRAPRARPSITQPGDDGPDAVDQPPAIVAPVAGEPQHEAPIVAPVASYASDDVDPSEELFAHTPAAGRVSERSLRRPSFDRQRWVVPIAAGALAVIAAIVLVLILRGGNSNPQPTPLATANVTTTNVPTTAPTAAPSGPNANVPMRVVSSSVHPGSTSGSYTASASVRNPTDFEARNITVTFTLKDAAGAVLATVVRTIPTLPSGGTGPITVSGTNPGGKQPASVSVTAVAAQIAS